MSISNTDNTLRRARSLGALDGRRVQRGGLVGQRDKTDVFQFELAQLSNLAVAFRLPKSKSSATATLLDSSGAVVANLRRGGARQRRLTRTLATGIYYLRIDRRRGDAKYSLTAAATLAEPGNAPAIARNIGTLTGGYAQSDSVGTADDLDYYRFSLDQISRFSANLGALSQTVDLRLYADTNRNGAIDGGELLTFEQGDATKNAFIARSLPSGTYFLELDYAGSADSTGYTLTLAQTSTPGNLPVDPSGNPSSGFDLGSFVGAANAADLVGSLDELDYYKFTLNQIGSFSANLGALSQNVDLKLYFDADQNGVLDSSEQIVVRRGSATENAFIARTLPAGQYLVELDYVGSVGNTTPYDLNLSLIPNPGNLPFDPSNNPSTAFNLGTLSSSVNAIDLVGSLDNRDYYKFSLSQVSSFNATVGELSQGIELKLFNDANSNGVLESGERIALARGNSSTPALIARTLQPGEYLVEIDYAGTPTNNTRYSLTLGVG